MKRIIYTVVAAAAILTGSVAAAAPAFASSGPATVKVVIHAADHADTTSVCNAVNDPDCVWAHDNLSRQIVATPNAGGTSWSVVITDNGSFAGTVDPVSGNLLASNGPVSGTYHLTVTGGAPDAKNLPSQQGNMGTTAMIAQLFGVSPAAVSGGDYSYSYQNGAYTQDTAGAHGGLRGGAVTP
jgi:hypothetical protein